MLPYRLPSYVFGPEWFHGFDSVIELIAVIVSILLVYYSYKCYKITSENRYGYFSIAFMSLTLAFIAKVAGTLAIYSSGVRKSAVAKAIDMSFANITIYSINSLAFLFYIFFTILGLMMLFLIVSRLTWKNKRVMAVLLYFVFVAAWLGAIHYQLFYLTAFVMLAIITYSYYANYMEIRSKNSLLVTAAFSILLISTAIFTFAIYAHLLYVIAEVLQLLGFLFLLMPFMLIFIKNPKNHCLIK